MNQFNITILAIVLSLSAAAVAEEPDDGYLTADEYIETARPFLHFSCEGAWNSVNEDPDAYIEKPPEAEELLKMTTALIG